jgi:hypothetical protein
MLRGANGERQVNETSWTTPSGGAKAALPTGLSAGLAPTRPPTLDPAPSTILNLQVSGAVIATFSAPTPDGGAHH